MRCRPRRCCTTPPIRTRRFGRWPTWWRQAVGRYWCCWRPCWTTGCFTAALQRYSRRPGDPAGLARQLVHLGLEAEVTTASFRLAIAKDRWLAMVADRWMSLLSKFTELAAGLAEIEARYAGPVLEFDDSFVFIVARRKV
jgi:hypothetical protein